MVKIEIAFKNTDKMFRKIFTANIRPKLEHAASVWSPHLSGDIDLLEEVQRRATEVPDVWELRYRRRPADMELLLLEKSREREDMITANKILNRFDEVNIE